MPKIFPFKALLPKAEYVQSVSAKSTDFTNQDALINEIRSNENSFHHVTKSHLSYSGAYQEPEKFLPFALQYIKRLKSQQILSSAENQGFYLYEQTRIDGKVFKGIIGLCSIDDYKNNRIKKHEEIRPSRLKFLVELFKTTKVMGEPTLLAHQQQIETSHLPSRVLYDFESVDGKKHKVSEITNLTAIQEIQSEMENIRNFYIADGHHRSASTEYFNTHVQTLENDKSMCFILQEDQLEILPFHRLIKPLTPFTKDEILSKFSQFFKLSKSDSSLYTIQNCGVFGLYLEGDWYHLKLKTESNLIDVEVVEDSIVKSLFNITDSRTDSQISFHPYTSGEQKLIRLVDEGTYRVAITMKACSFEDVRKVADNDRTLPPKSTYIEPKLRSGMVIQEFNLKD